VNLTFYIPNLRNAAYIAGGGFTEDANYPLVNLFNGIPEIPAKSTVLTSGQRIVFDQGAAKAFDSFVLLNHNFTTNNGLRVRCASNSAITTDVETVFATATPQADGDLIIDDIPTFTKRYVAFEWMGAGPLAAVPTLGGAYVCAKYVFPKPWEFSSRPFYVGFGTSRSRSLSGIRRAAQQYGGMARFQFSFLNLEDADRDMLQRIYTLVRGPLIPFMCRDHTGAQYYVSFVNDEWPWTVRAYNLNDMEPLVLETVRSSYGITSGMENTEEVIAYI
jgi:hypothetical protein